MVAKNVKKKIIKKIKFSINLSIIQYALTYLKIIYATN